MAINAQIPLSVVPPQIDSPQKVAGTLALLANQQGEAQERQIRVQQIQRQQADQDAMRSALKDSNGDLRVAAQKVMALNPELGATLLGHADKADEAKLNLETAKIQHDLGVVNYTGQLVGSVLGAQSPDEAQQAWTSMRAQMQHAGLSTDGLPEQFDPAVAQRFNDQALTAQQRLTERERQITEQRQAAAAAAQVANQERDDKRAEDAAAATEKYRAATLAQRGAEKRATQNDVTDLTPAGLDMAALNYRKTGVMPALGNGDKTTRKRIIDRAAVLTPDDVARIEGGGMDVAGNKASFQADSGSLKKLQAQRDSIGAFEQTAQKNIDVFLNATKKIVDTGSPLLNAPVRMISGAVLGSPDQAAYDAARQVAINEIAKITSNPTLSGTLSDSARHEVEAFNPRTATMKQTVAVMKLLKQDMQNRTTALDAEIGAVKGRIGGDKGAGAASADPLGIRKK